MKRELSGPSVGGERIDRRFLGWDRPVLHSAVGVLLEEIAPVGDVDLTGALIVLPGARAGRRLTELLLERCETLGRPLRPPLVVTAGGLPERLYRPARPVPDPPFDRFAWVKALRDADGGRLGEAFPGLGTDPGPAALHAFAGTLRTLHSQVGAAGHDFSDVARACGRTLLFDDAERWWVLSEVQEQYRAVLLRHGVQDREWARREVLEEGRIASDHELWVIGAPDLPAVTRAFLAAASETASVRILIAAPLSMAHGFDALGVVIPDAWAAATACVPDERLRVMAGPDAQASAVAEYLADVARELPAEAVTIGVPDEEVVPFLGERLRAAGVSVRYAGGREMDRTPAFRLLEAIAAYLETREFDRFAALLRHPVMDARLRGSPAASPASPSTLADRYRALHLPIRLGDGRTLPAGGERARAPLESGVRALRDRLEALLEGVRTPRTLSTWGSPIRTLLLDLYGADPIDRRRDEGAELLEFAGRIQDALEAFERLPDELDAQVPGHLFLRFLLEEVREGPVPPDQDESAVELLGWLELALDDAPVMVLTGANEPHLPESMTADPYLPHALRQILGMLDNEGRWARDLLHLRTILETRSHVRVLAGRRDASGSPLRLSRLLLADEPAVVARRLIRFLGESAGDESGAAGGPDAPRREAESVHPPVRLPPEPILSAPAPPASIAVTEFRLLLADPYHFALTRIRGLEGEDDRARELDGAAFGTFAHRILERFGRVGGADLVDPEAIREVLFDLLAGEARAQFGSRPLPAVRLQIEQLRLRLRGFADWQVGWARDGWRILGVEAVPAAEGVAFPVDGHAILLRGKVDRVDRNERTGEWCVLDYKTGDRARTPEEAHRSGPKGARRWIDLQLPLYHRLFPALRDPSGGPLVPPGDLGAVRVGYIVLPRDPAEVGARFADWSAPELAEAEEVAGAAVRVLRANHFSYDPDRSAIRADHPLAAVVGGRVLRLDEEGEADAD